MHRLKMFRRPMSFDTNMFLAHLVWRFLVCFFPRRFREAFLAHL